MCMTWQPRDPRDDDLPTDAEIEAWAERERRRRQQWAQGPTPEQAALWATLEHERRRARRGGTRGGLPSMRRSLALCAAGGLRLLLTTSVHDVLEYLVEEGLEWEEQFSRGSRYRPGRLS